MTPLACLACAIGGAILAALGICYLLYLSHERFRKSHTKDTK